MSEKVICFIDETTQVHDFILKHGINIACNFFKSVFLVEIHCDACKTTTFPLHSLNATFHIFPVNLTAIF